MKLKNDKKGEEQSKYGAHNNTPAQLSTRNFELAKKPIHHKLRSKYEADVNDKCNPIAGIRHPIEIVKTFVYKEKEERYKPSCKKHKIQALIVFF